MPINLEFRLKKGGLWELGLEPTQGLVDLIPNERALRVYEFNDTKFAITNARLVKITREGTTESAWWCKLRDVQYPAKNLIEDPREEIVVEPRGVLFVGRPFVIEAAAKPVRERHSSEEEFDAVGMTASLLQIAMWCKMQHDHRPRDLDEVGLIHAPDCPELSGGN